MFRIRFKDFSGCEHEYNYSSTNSIEEMKEEYNRICQIEGNTDVNIYEVEEHNITITMLNPKSRFTPIKEKISKIRQVLSYVHSVAMPYGLSLVKGKVEADMARIKDECRETLIMLNDSNPNGNNVFEEEND